MNTICETYYDEMLKLGDAKKKISAGLIIPKLMRKRGGIEGIKTESRDC